MTEGPTLAPPRVAIAASVAGVAIVVVGALTSVRAAVIVLAVFALAGAVARVFSPPTRAFAVRKRGVDVTVLAVLGFVLLALGLTTPLG